MLSIQNHGALSEVFGPEWAKNPCNAANGGPLESPGEFWRDAEARSLFEACGSTPLFRRVQ